jgi:hypothetical protein
MDEEFKAAASETLRVIREGDYSLIRPSSVIFPELVSVILLLDERIETLTHRINQLRREHNVRGE